MFRPTARPAYFRSETADRLEDRTMLSAVVAQNGQNSYRLEAGEILCVPAEYTQSLSVTADGDGTAVIIQTGANVGSVQVMSNGATNLVLESGTSAGDVTFTAGSGTGRILLREGATAGGVTMTGGPATDILRLQPGSMTGAVSFAGNGGDDRLDVLGTVDGSLAMDGGEGDDRLLVTRQGDVTSDTSGSFGDGEDLFFVLGGGVGNVDLDLNGGDDTVFVRSGSVVDGNLSLNGQGGSDAIRMLRGGVEVNGNMTVNSGAGADTVILDGLTVMGNQQVNLGDSGDGKDMLTFGDDLIMGDSNVSFLGNAEILERRARELQSDYKISGGSGEATIRTSRGSEIGGNYTVENKGDTLVQFRGIVRMGNATITTAGGEDHVLIFGNSRIEGNLNITTGAKKDVVGLVAGRTEVIGNGNISTGAGEDFFRTLELFLDGNLTVDLGAAGPDADSRDRAFFGKDEVTGDVTTNWSGGAVVAETDARTIGNNVKFSGGSDPSSVRMDNGSEVAANFELTTSGATDARLRFQTMMGNATIGTGSGDDELDLTGVEIGGGNNLSVNTGAGDDLVTLTDAVVSGNLNVSLGGGDDEVDNSNTQVDGTPTFTGGAGTDTITNPNQGNVTGFEN